MVTHDGLRRIETSPGRQARAKPKFSVISVSKKVFVESADLIQHFAAVHGCAAIGPQDLLQPVVLARIVLAVPTAAILAVRIDQMAYLIDLPGVLPNQYFRGSHA